MKFAIFSILFAFCFLHAKSDVITEFEKELDEAVQKMIDYEDQYNSSTIKILEQLSENNLSEILFRAWNDTKLLNEALRKQANTTVEVECLDSENLECVDELTEVAFNECEDNYLNTSEPDLENIQDAYKVGLMIKQDLNEAKKNCSTETEESMEECVSLKLIELKSLLNILLDQIWIYLIEAESRLLELLSKLIRCHEKMSTEVKQKVIDCHKKFRQCISKM